MKQRRSIRVKCIAVAACALIAATAMWSTQRQTVLTLGIYTGGRWDVPLEDSNAYFDHLIQKFQEENPQVAVEYKSGILKRDYSEWLAQSVLQDDLPDVFLVLSSDLDYLISIDALEQLDPWMQTDVGFDQSRFFKTALREGRSDAGQYALAYEISPTLMFVNKTLLAEAGVAMPDNNWTWDEYYQICHRVSDPKNGRFGVYDYSWREALYSNNLNLFSADGSQAYFDHPEVVETIIFLQRLQALNVNQTVTAEHFDSGQVAFRPFLFAAYKAYKPFPYSLKKYDNFEWECISFPKGPNGSNASLLQSSMVGISSRSKNKDLAWEFVKQMTCSEDMQAGILEYSYGIPSLKAVFESDIGVETMHNLYQNDDIWLSQNTLLEVIENSVNEPSFQNYNAVMSHAEREMYIIINSQTDVEPALRNLNKEINDMLKK